MSRGEHTGAACLAYSGSWRTRGDPAATIQKYRCTERLHWSIIKKITGSQLQHSSSIKNGKQKLTWFCVCGRCCPAGARNAGDDLSACKHRRRDLQQHCAAHGVSRCAPSAESEKIGVQGFDQRFGTELGGSASQNLLFICRVTPDAAVDTGINPRK